MIGERFSQVTIDSARNKKKNRPYDVYCDSTAHDSSKFLLGGSLRRNLVCRQFQQATSNYSNAHKLSCDWKIGLVSHCKHFPEKSHGSHWLLLGATIEQGQKQLQVFVWDCLGQPVSLYATFSNRLNQLYGKTGFRQISLTLQNASSNMCGLYCLFLIHYKAKMPDEMSQLHEKFKLNSEIKIIRFIKNKHNTLFRYTIF